MNPLFDQVLRRNPEYRLLRANALPTRTARKLRLPWVLLGRRGSGLPIKTISEGVAGVLSAFDSPRTAGSVAGTNPDADYRRFLLKQVFDGVLQARVRGRFVSGVNGLLHLSSPAAEEGPRSDVGRLSDRAIELAYTSALERPLDVASWLYHYNRLPLTRRWSDRFANEESLLEFLGCSREGTWEGSGRSFRCRFDGRSRKRAGAWYVWEALRPPSGAAGEGTLSKVYLSSLPEDVPELLRAFLPRAEGSGLLSFKIAKGAEGLLRPDKVVAYFASPSGAASLAGDIARRASHLRAHGVPFTFQQGPSGLVSSGIDPPPSRVRYPWGEGESWRVWVVNRIAGAIVTVRKAQPRRPLSVIRLALEASGIDPVRWSPLTENWYEGA